MYQRNYTREELNLSIILGKNIRKAREEMNMNLQEVSTALKYPKSKLSEIENGKKIPNAVLLGRLSELFEVSVSFFYTGNETDVGMEKYFDVARMFVSFKKEINTVVALKIKQFCINAFPNQSASEELIQEAEEFAKQARRMIANNNLSDGAWQDMKGGTNFEIKLGHLESKLRVAKDAMHLQKRAKKQLDESIQMELELQ